LPAEWILSVEARASGIHRWDLTERPDNPRLALHCKGRWSPSSGNVKLEEILLSAPKSNLRGSVIVSTLPETHFRARVDSAGIQASDLLAWFRAFRPGIAEGISVDQYFTGSASVSSWPLKLESAAFSSAGGKAVVPGFAEPFRIGAVRGGLQRNSLVLDPATI